MINYLQIPSHRHYIITEVSQPNKLILYCSSFIELLMMTLLRFNINTSFFHSILFKVDCFSFRYLNCNIIKPNHYLTKNPDS